MPPRTPPAGCRFHTPSATLAQPRLAGAEAMGAADAKAAFRHESQPTKSAVNGPPPARDSCCCLIMAHDGGYCMRANSVQSYLQVNMDVAKGGVTRFDKK